MRRWLQQGCVALFSLAAAAFTPTSAQAQIDGLRFEAGLAALTNAGDIAFDSGDIESEAGWALRGRVRYGLGVVSFAGEIQQASQGYDTNSPAGSPQNLNGTYLGLSIAIHPFEIFTLSPYFSLGKGKHYFADERIDADEASGLYTYGIGCLVGKNSQMAIDVEARLFRQTKLHTSGSVHAFKYDPKVVSVMLSFRR
jgi:hypothetical protein